jgi:hypothetical protein
VGYYMAGGYYRAGGRVLHSVPPSDTQPDTSGPRHRRMNVGNGRALGHAMTRVKHFAKFAHKAIEFSKRYKFKKHRR